eukprot:4116528-Prymnesium_polylepis.1
MADTDCDCREAHPARASVPVATHEITGLSSRKKHHQARLRVSDLRSTAWFALRLRPFGAGAVS